MTSKHLAFGFQIDMNSEPTIFFKKSELKPKNKYINGYIISFYTEEKGILTTGGHKIKYHKGHHWIACFKNVDFVLTTTSYLIAYEFVFKPVLHSDSEGRIVDKHTNYFLFKDPYYQRLFYRTFCKYFLNFGSKFAIVANPYILRWIRSYFSSTRVIEGYSNERGEIAYYYEDRLKIFGFSTQNEKVSLIVFDPLNYQGKR
jgi:hypothetical protein